MGVTPSANGGANSPVLQIGKLRPSKLLILSHTDTKRQKWVLTPAQGSSHCTTAVPSLGNWPSQHLVALVSVPWAPPVVPPSLPSSRLSELTEGCMEVVRRNTAADMTFTLRAQKILEGMKVFVRDGKKGRERLQE